MEEFNAESVHIRIGIKWYMSWSTDLRALVKKTKPLIILAIVIVAVYVLSFLGSWSPIHCRIILTVVTISCIQLSIMAGFGICYHMGYKKSDFH